MKWILWIVISLIALVGVIALVGYLLPVGHVASRSAEFNKPPEDRVRVDLRPEELPAVVA